MLRTIQPKSFVKYAVLSPLVLGGGYYLSDEKRRRQTVRAAYGGYRIANLVGTVGVMVVDYTYTLYYKYADDLEELSQKKDLLKKIQKEHEIYLINYHNDLPRKDYWWSQANENRKLMDQLTIEINQMYKLNRDRFYGDLHRRNGRRLRDMCAKNGGVYVKIGQHLAMLDHVLPREYQEALVTLLADTPQSSYESVTRVFQEEFNNLTPTDLFDKFDPIPIASASLAQVHIAYKENRKYAVKVQHEGLRDGADADRFMITLIVDLLSARFREFNYRWLTKELNHNLPLEMDFRNELKNMLEVIKDLKPLIDTGDVTVPQPIPALTTERILTMSFEEGYHLNNIEQIKALQLQSIDISTLVSKIFSDQIFRHGFVHCDPHEANLLFRPHPTKKHKPQIVLLDHGLYRRLDDSFRRNYSRLWQSIILADAEGIKEYGQKLNAGPSYPLLAAILTLKPWDSIISADADSNLNDDGMKKATDLILLQSYAKLYYQEIVDLLASVPSDLLLVFKTNDCLRHLDKVLSTPVNSTAVVAKTASNVILQEEFQEMIQQWQGFQSITKLWTIAEKWFIIMSRIFIFSNVVYYGQTLYNYYRSWMSYWNLLPQPEEKPQPMVNEW